MTPKLFGELMKTEGYLIVLKPAASLRYYEAQLQMHKSVPNYLEGYNRYREAFANFDLLAYRGVSRRPLEAYISNEDMEDDCNRDLTLGPNVDARTRLAEIAAEMTIDYYDDSLIGSLDQAIEVFAMLDKPDLWEIIHVQCGGFQQQANTLGFDVGYWGSNYFSLIADIVVTPLWHPPDLKDCTEVTKKLSRLNENLLFGNLSDVNDFIAYYKSKDWAETESTTGEFHPIQVTIVEPLSSNRKVDRGDSA